MPDILSFRKSRGNQKYVSFEKDFLNSSFYEIVTENTIF
ncbi:hypothetical protein LEP1GSC192_2184 [Leptospira sp. B5-022]|nr:hypothetical protein LEP1GSC192_2184 [Leptospira sp. B5-022]